jgi:hypothetical protein
MTKGGIYYSDCCLDPKILLPCQKQLRESFEGEIVSVTLKPMNFGNSNIVVDRQPSFITYLTQIVAGLEALKTDVVFFLEHDILYNKSCFDFTPLNNDTFYYNSNVYRWKFGSNFAITYDGLISLSGLCVNREFALDHFQRRLTKAKTMPTESNIKEPSWARSWGYEAGLKRTHNGGFSNEKGDTWRSELPIIDIRHSGTMTKEKVTLDSFKHPPVNWKQIPITEVPGWKEFVWI